MFGKLTPFADLRLGCNFVNGGGVYFSPSVGYRFNWGRKMGINVALGYTLHSYSTDIYRIVEHDLENDQGSIYVFEKTGTYTGTSSYFSFRLGIDF